MRLHKRWATAATVVAVLFTMAVPFALTARAATTPPWEPDPNAEGSITFYDAAGHVITGGNNLSHLFDYAVASTAATRTTIKAQTTFGFPDHTKPDSSTWFQAQSSTATNYPNLAAPAPINGFTNPVATVVATEANLAAILPTTILDTTAGYANIVQVRLKDSGTCLGCGVLAKPFWETDIQFNVATNTWTQVFPAPVTGPTATTTTLTATPNPSTVGATVTLTATETPAAAGSVQFKDGATNLGAAVAVAGGTASTTTSSLTAGSHALSAVFTPSVSTAFSASTGTFTATVNPPPATATTTSLGISPPSPITVGTVSTLTATVAPSGATGSVQFLDGATAIGVPVALAGGTATKTTTFKVNTHQIKAVFTPTDPTAFATSQSAVVSYVVNPVPAAATTTTFAVTPASPQVFGTSLTFTGTVTPSTAVGSVQFLDGTTVIGTGPVSGGTATASSSALGAGTHLLSAQFVPTVPANFGTSQSAAASYVITQAASAATLSVGPPSPAPFGTSVMLTASVTPGTLGGTVQFSDGAATLGTPVTVTGGTAALATTALAAGSHSLTAVFTPTSPNFTTATSNTVTYVIDPPPAGATTTTLGVSPVGPVTAGTTETLTATVAPATAHGTVQFVDGVTAIGAPVTLAGGSAHTTTTLAVGSHSLSAEFVSADTGVFLDSTSAAVTYLVKPPPTDTTTTLAVTPASPVTFGTSITLDATVSPAAAGTAQFLDGATVLGTTPVGAGAASFTTVGLSGGTHSLTVRFVPAAPLDFSGSTSTPASSLVVTAAATTTALAVTPAGPVTRGTTVTLTATVTPATALGLVSFRNGSTLLGTVAASDGTAVLTTSALPVGTASLAASFAAAIAADFAPSASPPVTLAVLALPKIDSVTSAGHQVALGGTVPPGAALTVHGSGFQAGETVTLAVHSTMQTLGTASADGQGAVVIAAALPASLASGGHTLSLAGALGTATFQFSISVAPTPTPTPTPTGTTSGVNGLGSVSSGGSDLASTGADVFGVIAVGLALLGAGLMILMTGRRPGSHRAR